MGEKGYLFIGGERWRIRVGVEFYVRVDELAEARDVRQARLPRAAKEAYLSAYLVRDEDRQGAHVCEEAHLRWFVRIQPDQHYTTTHLVHIVHNAVHDLSLERLEHDRSVPRDKLCLATPAEDHALAILEDGHDGDDVSELTGACSFDIGV